MFENNLKDYRESMSLRKLNLKKAGITNNYVSRIKRGIKNSDSFCIKNPVILEQNGDKIF